MNWLWLGGSLLLLGARSGVLGQGRDICLLTPGAKPTPPTQQNFGLFTTCSYIFCPSYDVNVEHEYRIRPFKIVYINSEPQPFPCREAAIKKQ